MSIIAGRRESPIRAWVRALGNISQLRRDTELILPRLVDQLGAQYGAMPAVQSTRESLSYLQLAERKNQYARWALHNLPAEGGVVCLLMENCPDYLAIWLGVTQVGGVVALINTNLVGEALLQAVCVVKPAHIIVDFGLAGNINAIFGALPTNVSCWVHGEDHSCGLKASRLDPAVYAGFELPPASSPIVRADETALLISTSGTTGMPKAAKISHYKILEWSYWFAGIMDTHQKDSLYNCLPMYHSTGGVASIGALLVNGGSIVLRRRFSARRFWSDIAGSNCTIFVYIGELCRYLVSAPTTPMEALHNLRLCIGNGLREDVWINFAARFRIPQILEFYASTEGNVALYNIEGRPGAIGRVPSFLAHRFPVTIVQCDPLSGEACRGSDGHCIPCAPGEVGEALGRIGDAETEQHRRFDGYTDGQATERKILRNVFVPGDAWFRTGDLMRRDTAGFYYFVDRVGDTFRWKGENVSTTQVEDVICRCPGVTGAVVYGVAIPGTEGRAGMAAITVDATFQLPVLHTQLVERLPAYARPMFIRICTNLQSTGTFKPIKAALMREGYEAERLSDAIYVDTPSAGGFTRLPGSHGRAAASNEQAARAAGRDLVS